MKFSKTEKLANEVFLKTKQGIAQFLNENGEGYKVRTDDEIRNKIEKSIVSRGRKGLAFDLPLYYRMYRFYLTDSENVIPLAVDYFVHSSLSKNRLSLLSVFQFKGL
jgi:hypothetical protein